ncbi:MAG: hypothetical protein QGH93_00110 [Gammaproteobacteria bacterium]|jgi:hypothetical protein|nr:hypothetical protein [Gammaproteobacteria bacterium]
MKIINNRFCGMIALALLLIVAGNAWGYSVSPDSSEWSQGKGNGHSQGGHDHGSLGGWMMDEDSDSGHTWGPGSRPWGSGSMWDSEDHQFGDHGGPDFSGWDHGGVMDCDSDSDSDTDFDYDEDSDFDDDSDSSSDYGGPPGEVPLPAPLLLLGSGLLGLVGFVRRSRKSPARG